MSILNNAIASIQVGVEDYLSKDSKRKYSAVRNVFAGLLLLYKEKLCRLSPRDDKELLIRANIGFERNEQGQISFSKAVKKTVNVQEIKKRFKSLKIGVDWKNFDKVNFLRNEVEHYYTEKSTKNIDELVAISCLLIRNFIVEELEQDPARLLGEECWQVLLEVRTVYEQEKLECNTSLSEVDWKYSVISNSLSEMRCPSCSSGLVKANKLFDEYPNISLQCANCNSTFKYTDIMADHLNEVYFADSYIAATQGGDYPIDDCSQCWEATFIVEEGLCTNCGYSTEYLECVECGITIGLREETAQKICDRCDYARSMLED